MLAQTSMAASSKTTSVECFFVLLQEWLGNSVAKDFEGDFVMDLVATEDRYF